ncbi:hypothetical protein [Ferrovibrio terrae]|uniref:hypothetical protein n=1 Tax=Ferrovibrio terrae TaxID=2594003 RepID=UPI00313848D4
MRIKLPVGTLQVAVILALMALMAHAAEDPAEIEVVVAATREAHPDSAKLCQSGQAGILNAVSTQAKALAMDGKIHGNPQALGVEASAKIGKDCFGG